MDNKKMVKIALGGLAVVGGLALLRKLWSSKTTKEEKREEKEEAKRPLNIIIAGAPGSGKGTQCELIKETFGIIHVSTGDIFRAAVKAGTPLGKKAQEFMDRGDLVPDDVVIGMIKQRLLADDCQQNGWLLDGYPRTGVQAQALKDNNINAQVMLMLEVPDDVLVERVCGRRSDPETGKIYHMKFAPPETEEIAARLKQRGDDTEDKIKVRLEKFHEHVDAVRDHFKDIEVVLDGNQNKKVVFEQISEAISNALP